MCRSKSNLGEFDYSLSFSMKTATRLRWKRFYVLDEDCFASSMKTFYRDLPQFTPVYPRLPLLTVLSHSACITFEPNQKINLMNKRSLQQKNRYSRLNAFKTSMGYCPLSIILWRTLSQAWVPKRQLRCMVCNITRKRDIGTTKLKTLGLTYGRTDGSKNPINDRCPLLRFSLIQVRLE